MTGHTNRGSDIGMSFLAAAILSASSGMAGTIINTNLPAGDIIVNIGGTADGAATSGGPGQDLWYQPFNASNQLLEVTMQPGTYTFRLLNQTDAASLFPSLTGPQLGEIGGGAWTFNSPWTTDYMVFDSSAASIANQPQLFSGAINPSGSTFSGAATAYSAAIAGGYYNTIVVNGGRYTGTTASQYTFASAETLIFVVPDYFLPDNNGIDSVLISPASPGAAPEPATWSLLFAGLAAVALFRRTCAELPSDPCFAKQAECLFHRFTESASPASTRKQPSGRPDPAP